MLQNGERLIDNETESLGTKPVTLPGFPDIAAEELPGGVIRILPTTDPLSCDVFLIRNETVTLIFDIGANPRVATYIASIPGEKHLVLSHFHADHTTNLLHQELGISDLYVSPYTDQHLKDRSLLKDISVHPVTEPISITLSGSDTPALTISPLTATHAKGSLMMEYDRQLLFLGDSVYGMHKGDCHVFNAQLLSQQIRLLEQTTAPIFIPSHRKSCLCPRAMIIKFLQSVYAKREKNNPYIPVK